MSIRQTPRGSAPAKQRIPQSVRTATTRLRLIEGAISALHDRGYAAASTTEILRRTKLSTGTMLHHFPTKVDLMLAAAMHIFDLQTARYTAELALIEDPRDRFIGITEIAWRALREPTGMALLEILMATRSDPELGRRFLDVGSKIEQFHEDSMWDMAQEIGLTDRQALKQMIDVVLGAMRGLSIQLLFSKTPERVESAMKMLIDWKVEWLSRVLPTTGT